jgi:hypothetical protein
MTRKVYKSAMGKAVDLGSLLLRNENIRAVGNMNVNARGDRLDSNNRVIETRTRQAQRRYDRQSNVTSGPVHTGTGEAQRQSYVAPVPEQPIPVADPQDTFSDLPMDDPVEAPVDAPVEAPVDTPVDTVQVVEPAPQDQTESVDPIPQGGLAAAIARSREVKQELMKTPRQLAQAQGVKRI